MLSFFTEWRNASKLAGQKFHVIFFAENGYYFQYYQHLYEALLNTRNIEITYITSDKNDPVLKDKRIQAFYLKNTLAGIFPRLQADLMIMTMPDLGNFIFKRSPGVKKYIYVFHALVSTHQQYRAHAFDHYDALFCTGPQQESEVREAEQLYAGKAKECLQYGYPLLSLLKEKIKNIVALKRKVLIAPSWYKEGILNTCIIPLVEELLKDHYELWIRPHPEFIKRNKKVYEHLVKRMAKKDLIRFDNSPSVYTHLIDAGHLVTDRSGIALEYALATCRPVMFIDTPLKIQNPNVGKFSMVPLENAVRHRIGSSVHPGELHKLRHALEELRHSAAEYRLSIQSVEEAIVFSPAHWQNGLRYIESALGL